MPAEFYNNILYPLQDKVLPIFEGSPFCLTGGTALSCGYYNHRYSDNLYYFINAHPDFTGVGLMQIDKIKRLLNIKVEIDLQSDSYFRLFLGEEKFKIEMVNDVPSHIGTSVKHPMLFAIDSKENILANKITAIINRESPKDVADIYVLLKDGLSIKKALLDSDSKAASIAPLLIAEILHEFDYTLLDSEIKWVKPVSSSEIAVFLKSIALSIVRGTL